MIMMMVGMRFVKFLRFVWIETLASAEARRLADTIRKLWEDEKDAAFLQLSLHYSALADVNADVERYCGK